MTNDHELPVYKQFNLEQLFVESELDYSIAESHAQALGHLSSMSNQCFWIFDYFKNNFYYISDNTDFFPKEDKSTVMQDGYDYFIRNTHPNDILYLLSIHKAAFFYLTQLPPEDSMTNYKVCYTIRLRDAKGVFVSVNQQVKPLVMDKRGNGWLSMGLFEIDYQKMNYLPYIQNTITGAKIDLAEVEQVRSQNAPQRVSEREIELLGYMAKNMNQKEIALRMSISVNTLQVHRKNLYRKLLADSRVEALKNAYYLGIL